MNKHQKGNGSIDTNGIYVVTPSNMGRGIKYNEQTKKYEVQISQGNGNTVNLKDDGLYVDLSMPTDKIYLYVANNGSDTTGDGSKAKPFATIHHACSTVRELRNHVEIRLRERHTFVLPNEQIIIEGGRHFGFSPYDDTNSGDDGNFDKWADRPNVMPVIKLATSNPEYSAVFIPRFGAGLTFRYCILNLEKASSRNCGFVAGNDGTLGIRNCGIKLSNAGNCTLTREDFPFVIYDDWCFVLDERRNKTPTTIFNFTTGSVYRARHTATSDIVAGSLTTLSKYIRQGYFTGVVKKNDVPINVLTNVII